MFNIEGTKHEKVVLVVLAYIIGLTSGFIAFATQYDHKKVTSVAPVNYSVASTAPSQTEQFNTYDNNYENNGMVLGDVPLTGEFVYYAENRLFVELPEGRMLLSVHENVIDADLGEDFLMQGTHIAEPVYLADEAQRNIFFCEFMNSEDQCFAYIFSAAETVIRPIAVDGNHLVLTDTEAETAAWNGNTFSVGNFVSLPLEPWLLTLR